MDKQTIINTIIELAKVRTYNRIINARLDANDLIQREIDSYNDYISNNFDDINSLCRHEITIDKIKDELKNTIKYIQKDEEDIMNEELKKIDL